MCVCVCVWSQKASETVSEVVNFKIFLGGGGMPPDPPSFSTLLHARISPLYE